MKLLSKAVRVKEIELLKDKRTCRKLTTSPRNRRVEKRKQP